MLSLANTGVRHQKMVRHTASAQHQDLNTEDSKVAYIKITSRKKSYGTYQIWIWPTKKDAGEVGRLQCTGQANPKQVQGQRP